MGKKLALNVLYNVCIFVALAIAYEGVIRGQYAYLLASVFIVAVVIALKMKLLKEVKETTRKP